MGCNSSLGGGVGADDGLILSIDVGTLGAKVALLSAKNLELIALLSQEYGINHPRTGWAEQHPDVWWSTVVRLVKEVMRAAKVSPEAIVGVGISNTCPSLIPVDADGNALRPAILFMDQRSVKQAEYILSKVGLETVAEITGNRVAPGTLSVTSMLWIMDNEPDVYSKTYKFVHANGYLAFKLTGALGMDPANASLTGIFDIRRVRWSEELVSELDLDASKLPPIIWSYMKVGELSKDAARELNLIEGIPVAIGAADSACAALGLGVIRPGQAFETTGTSSVLAVVSDVPKFDIRLLNRCHVKEGLWLYMGAMSTTGASLRWFKDKLALPEVAVASELNVSPYAVIDEEAGKSPPGANNLLFLPYMMGERCPIWNPYARGVLIGLSLSHSRGDIARAILEGVAYGLRHNLEVIESLGITVSEVRVTGAAARSRLWRQIKADVLRKRVVTSLVKETAVVGAAVLAGVAARVFTNIESIADELYVKIDEVLEPNPEVSVRYDRYYALFKECYERLKSLFKELQMVD